MVELISCTVRSERDLTPQGPRFFPFHTSEILGSNVIKLYGLYIKVKDIKNINIFRKTRTHGLGSGCESF